MIARREFLLRIKDDLNLNIYEAKTWSALLSKGIASAGELASISGVPRSRCYDVLESLEKKGYILRRIGKPIKYIAVHPEEMVSRVSKDIDKETDRTVQLYEKLKNTPVFKELELLHKIGIEHFDSTKLSNSIIGRSNIQKQIKGMVKNAKNKIFIATSRQGFTRKSNMLKSMINILNKSKVEVKIVAPVSKPKPTLKNLDNLKIVNNDLGTRIVIVDGKELLFTLSDEDANKDSDTAIHVNSEFFAGAVHQIFDQNIE